MNKPICECEYCVRVRHFRAIGTPEEVLDYIADIELERDHMRAILDGSWPNAKGILERALLKVPNQVS